MTTTLGLDVGGAHLKAALAEGSTVLTVRQIACPLWQGFDRLDAALAEAAPLISLADQGAVTMTGELSDIFVDRHEGVERLITHLVHVLGPDTRFWMGRRGFGFAADALEHREDVASTNFLATAIYVATRQSDALLIDMGSTTTDIVVIRDGRPLPRGLTDADRLVSRELVYTGLTRTALMAIASQAPFQGTMQPLCREYFATMADVRRVLGDLPPGVDQHATADGKGKSRDESLARLARMFGRDARAGSVDDWRFTALSFSEAQLDPILDGCRKVTADAELHPDAPAILAGLGAEVPAVLPAVAKRLGRSFQTFRDLIETRGDDTALWATCCAPAVAVALLASAQ